MCNRKAVWPKHEEKYCEGHWETRRKLCKAAEELLTCRRIIRGTDYELYVIDHKEFGTHCGEFVVMREANGFFHILIVLYNEHDWQRKAFELRGDPERPTLAEIACDIPLDLVISSWGLGSYMMDVYAGEEVASYTGEF